MHPAFDKCIGGSLRQKSDVLSSMKKVTGGRQNKEATGGSRLKGDDFADNAMGIIPRKISQNNLETSILELGLRASQRGRSSRWQLKICGRVSGGQEQKGQRPLSVIK